MIIIALNAVMNTFHCQLIYAGKSFAANSLNYEYVLCKTVLHALFAFYGFITFGRANNK